MPEIPIGVELFGEDLPPLAVGHTYVHLQAVLDDLGHSITEGEPHWHVEEAVNLRVVASPNGVSESSLRQIADEADQAFRGVRDAADGNVEWPTALTSAGQRAVMHILEQLNTAETITVSFAEHEPITFDSPINLSMALATERPWREVSSVDGVLDLISVHSMPYFSIQEHVTKNRIRCIFPDEMIGSVKEALGARVVVDGLVHYNAQGVPTSVTNVTSLYVRPAPKQELDALIGAIPDFTDGTPAGEYVREMRGRSNAGPRRH